MPRVIRILLDRSKDSDGGQHFVSRPRQVPGPEEVSFHCTDSRLPLDAATLAQYDVLVICGQSLRPYADEELAAVEAFVSDGGGLLLAADTAVFESEAQAAPESMSQNQVARLFGGEFHSAECPGAVAHASLLIHPPYSDAQARPHPAVAGHQGRLLSHTAGFGPITPPTGAQPFVLLKASGLPVAAAGRHGKGRLVMVGATAFASGQPSPFACLALSRWLAGSRGVRGPVDLPRYSGEPAREESHGYYQLVVEPGVTDRAPCAAELLSRVRECVGNLLGGEVKPTRRVPLGDTVSVSPWHWRETLPGAAGEAVLARRIATRTLRASRELWDLQRLLGSLFTQRACELEMSLRLLGDLGYPEEAGRCRERADRWLGQMDRRARTFDLARSYQATQEEAPRGLQVLRELLAERGPGLLGKLRTALPAQTPCAHLPQTYAWQSDHAIYYLGLAARADLFPWFAARGYTVHPLPLVKPGAASTKRRLAARLAEALGDEAEPLSSRLEAAHDLAAMLPRPPGRRDEARGDAGSRLVEALRLAASSDGRSRPLLTALLKGGGAVGALAAITLADLGEAGAAGPLVAAAREADVRFRLMAGYALEKLGSPEAAGLSLLTVTGDAGRRLGRLDVIDDGLLWMHGLVEGYRVCNVICAPTVRRLTEAAAATEHYVAWVHTSPQWRRCGLSRAVLALAMAHPAATQCALSGLGTGVRNVAHRLYRDHGFTDMGAPANQYRDLAGGFCPRLPVGVVLRPYEAGDCPRVAALAERVDRAVLCDRPPWVQPAGGAPAFVALRDGQVVGFALAEHDGGDVAQLRSLALEPAAPPEVGEALLAMLHQELAGRGAKRLERETCEREKLQTLLQGAGYVTQPRGGVWLLQARHLPQFLSEIAPLLAERLAASEYKHWQGTIDLRAGRLQARLTVGGGCVRAALPGSRPADITLTCEADTATRVVLGRETPFAAHLQARLDIAPRLTAPLTGLLETLFPKVPLG